MALASVALPVTTVSSGGTISAPAWDVSDVDFVAFNVTSATSAPGLTLGGTLNSTSTSFVAVTLIYSTANQVITASSGMGIILAQTAGVHKLALMTSAAAAAAITIAGSKLLEI